VQGGRFEILAHSQDRNEEPHNRSVGDFCHELALNRLVGVFEQHLPEGKNRPEINPRIHLDVGLTPSLAEWRNKRKGQPVYQLQIELCEKALAQLATAKGVSQDSKDAARKKIESELTKLRTTKKPVFLESNLDGLETYDAEDVKLIREKLGGKK